VLQSNYCKSLLQNQHLSHLTIDLDSFVWSYGLELHYSDKHQGITCPIIVSDEEKQAVLAKKQ